MVRKVKIILFKAQALYLSHSELAVNCLSFNIFCIDIEPHTFSHWVSL